MLEHEPGNPPTVGDDRPPSPSANEGVSPLTYSRATLTVLAVSDLHVHSVDDLDELVARIGPDVVVYAGDGVARFGKIPAASIINAAEDALVATSTVPDTTVDGTLTRGRARVRSVPGHPELRHVVLGYDSRSDAIVEARPATGDPARPWRRRWILGSPWDLRVQQEPLADNSAGSWRRIAARVPHGIVGVVGNDGQPLDGSLFSACRGHDLATGPFLLPGIAFVGLPGAPSDEGHAFGSLLYDQNEARAHLLGQLEECGRRDVVLVSHAPPRGVLDEALYPEASRAGSSVVTEIVEAGRVAAVLCGHAHGRGGRAQLRGDVPVLNVASGARVGGPLRYGVLELTGRTMAWRATEDRCPTSVASLRGIGPSRASRLRNAGVRSVSDALDHPDLTAILGSRLADQVSAHAHSLATGMARFRLGVEMPAVHDMVIVDVESSTDRQDDPWLVSVLAPDREDVVQFEELGSDGLRDQLVNLTASVESLGHVEFLQWGTFDRAVLARAHARVGLDVPSWLSPDRWHDGMAILNRAAELPIRGRGLKDVAAWFGFRFRRPALDGTTLGIQYELWRDAGEPFDLRAAREYNADDVLAVRHVMTCLSAELERARRS